MCPPRPVGVGGCLSATWTAPKALPQTLPGVQTPFPAATAFAVSTEHERKQLSPQTCRHSACSHLGKEPQAPGGSPHPSDHERGPSRLPCPSAPGTTSVPIAWRLWTDSRPCSSLLACQDLAGSSDMGCHLSPHLGSAVAVLWGRPPCRITPVCLDAQPPGGKGRPTGSSNGPAHLMSSALHMWLLNQ